MRRLVAALCILVTGCSMSADTKLAEQSVRKFHEMLDAGEFAAIYAASAEALKNDATEEDFIAFLDAIHRKLGVTKSSTQQTWNVNYHTSGSFVTLVYSTAYEKGEAAETFVFLLQDEQALLAGYNINSRALILN